MLAGHAGARQELLLGVARVAQLHLQHLLERVGNARVDLFERHGETPASAPASVARRRLHEHAALREMIDHRGHEQRIAVGVPVDQLGESRRKLARRESGRDIRRHVRFLQPFEHHFMTQTVQQQILLQRFERAVGEDQFRRPQRAEHEQARGLAPPRDR